MPVRSQQDTQTKLGDTMDASGEYGTQFAHKQVALLAKITSNLTKEGPKKPPSR